MKQSVKDLKNLAGKRVLVRVDFNVPQDENGNITDDTRIREALPTIKILIEEGAKIILCSHLGRPKGVDLKYSMSKVADRLGELVSTHVFLANDVAGKDSVKKLKDLKNGEILVLENLRFEAGEEKNDPEFVTKLASLADIYIFDAFGTAHRKHASTYGVPKVVKENAIGLLALKEVTVITGALSSPERPFVAILGGKKVSDKISVIENMLKAVDSLIIGGAMAYTFIKAMGGDVGASFIEDDKVSYAKKILELADEKQVKIYLPLDIRAGREFSNDTKAKCFDSFAIASNYEGYDIGKRTVKQFKKVIKTAKTIVWNGPLGVFEFDKFAKGTNKIAKAVAKTKALSIVGGGDSIASINKLGLADKISHISTGGGASMALFGGEELVAITAIKDVK